MIHNLPVIIIISPLLGALMCPIISYFNRTAGRWFVTSTAALSFVGSVHLLFNVASEEKIRYWFGNWEPPLGVEFTVDSLSGVMLVLISFMGFLSTIYGMPFHKKSSRFKSAGYYSILSLLITGMLGMTATGDVFNMYVFLEITSLSGYALIAMGGDKGVLSAFRYLLIGTIGASFYLMGTAFLYGETGTLNMVDMSYLIKPVIGTGTTMVAMAFFLVGFGIKAAIFPLHGWQPAAYTNAHKGAAPIIAGVMGKIPAYAMLRFFYFVFYSNNENVTDFLTLLGIMASCGMIYGSVKAIQQRDLRRMLAYSSIAQIGYVGIGIAMGNYYGLLGAVMHIINHSFMKGGLFFAAGAIQYRYNITSINKLGQLYRKMPKTVAVIVIAALSMVGIPPTAGFFSKWYLALGAADSHHYIYIAVLIISSLLNAIYFFRLLENIFMNDKDKSVDFYKCEENHKVLPWNLLVPVLVCGVAIIGLGLCNTWFVGILSSVIMGVA